MDILLQKLFEMDRWENALETGIIKGIDKADLRRLTTPKVRAELYVRIRDGKYEIMPPHQALIPKDKPGEFRTVYVNENLDRIFLSIVNDMLFEMFHDYIHPNCKSYQKGIGCGKIVKEVSQNIHSASGKIIGWKSDLSKYFDSVPIEYIDEVFDMIENVVGKSAVIDVLRKYYHCDLCFDTDGNLIEHYQSLKQGCAVASFLADAILYPIDYELSLLNGYYVRYSDDCLYIGDDYENAMLLMKDMLGEMNMTLNPKKVEYLTHDRWFKFLGFAIKDDMISLSSGRLHTFADEIAKRTIRNHKTSLQHAINSVNSYLYHGDYDGHSWASNVLPIINNVHDIQELNKYMLDCLRAVATKKTKIGGLGYVAEQNDGVISRGKGQNVKRNREKTGKIDGILTLMCARNALLSDRAAYDTLVRRL